MQGFHSTEDVGSGTGYGTLRNRRQYLTTDSGYHGGGSVTRGRTVNMKGNFTGRSVKGGGGLGKSTSPCS